MGAHRAPRRRGSLPRIGRDTVITGTAVLLTIYEAILRSGDARATLLALYAAMMGLPAVLRADEARRNRDEDDK